MKIIITAHGIRHTTKGDWQNDWAVYFKKRDYDLKIFHFRYGYMLGIASWLMNFGWMRKRYVNKYVKFIENIEKRYPGAEISIIAHSFGGWLTEQMLAKTDVNFDKIIFVHCPISAYIEQTNFWNYLSFDRIKAIHSWSSHKDKVIGKIAIKPFGQNGYWGFMRIGNIDDRKEPAHKPYPVEIYNHHTNEDHSGVLNKILEYGDVIYKQVTGENDI